MKRSQDPEIVKFYGDSIFDKLALERMDRGQEARGSDYLDLDCIEQAQEEALDGFNWVVLENKKREYPKELIRACKRTCESLYYILEQMKDAREAREIKPNGRLDVRDYCEAEMREDITGDEKYS